MMCYYISIYISNPFFRFSLNSLIDAIGVTRITLSLLNSINAIDVTRVECWKHIATFTISKSVKTPTHLTLYSFKLNRLQNPKYVIIFSTNFGFPIVRL